MGNNEKRFNKWVIGLVLGSAVVGGLSMTKKGKSFWGRVADRGKKPFNFFRRGYREMKKTMKVKSEK